MGSQSCCCSAERSQQTRSDTIAPQSCEPNHNEKSEHHIRTADEVFEKPHHEKKPGEEPIAFTQIKRVESKDERDFVAARDLSKRVIERLKTEKPDALCRKKVTKIESDDNHISALKLRLSSGTGMVLAFPITKDTAETLRTHYCRFGASQPLHPAAAQELVIQFTLKYSAKYSSSVAEVTHIPRKLIVVGDTHGQLEDVLHIFHCYGPPSHDNIYLFNGDIADRGPNATEIYFLLFSYFLADPSSVIINRGNHEDEEMNSQEGSVGGGFRGEVQEKFSISLYEHFHNMMKILPLATVVCKQIFVVHGGIGYHGGMQKLTVDFIKTIDHTEFTMPAIDAKETKYLVWNDLLWSDPMDRKGQEKSKRGSGVTFGPDVTTKFLSQNPGLELIIRSHELPMAKKGCQSWHDGKLLTVFSASNYCGHSGNSGGVIIFDKRTFPEYEVKEHYAPQLHKIANLISSGVDHWDREGQLLQQQQEKVHDEQWWPLELSKLMVAIVENKPRIWSKFLEVTEGAPMVCHDVWVSLLKSSVGESWHWRKAWDQWGLPDDGDINFPDFLSRFSAVLSQKNHAAFKSKAITRLGDKVLQSHASLNETLKMFDRDGSGQVDMKELRTCLNSFHLGLSPSQLESLLHIFFKDASNINGTPKIEAKLFLGRFAMVYRHAEDSLKEGGRTEDERASHEALTRIGHLIATTPMNAIRKDSKRTPGAHEKRQNSKNGETANSNSSDLALKMVALFEMFDPNHDGFIDTHEFVAGMSRIPGIFDITLSKGAKLDVEMLRKLARFLDKSGFISVFEFLEALSFDDNDGVGDALAEHILSVLFRYRLILRAASRLFDKESKGNILEEHFLSVLRALNAEMDESNHHFSDSQMMDLCEAISEESEKTRTIDYDTFLDGFEIVDAENPASAVRFGANKRRNPSKGKKTCSK